MCAPFASFPRFELIRSGSQLNAVSLAANPFSDAFMVVGSNLCTVFHRLSIAGV